MSKLEEYHTPVLHSSKRRKVLSTVTLHSQSFDAKHDLHTYLRNQNPEAKQLAEALDIRLERPGQAPKPRQP